MKNMMKTFGIVVIVAMVLGILPFTALADGSYGISTDHVVLSPGETATITVSASNAAGRVDWGAEGAVTSAGSAWLENDTSTITVTADSVGTGYITVVPTYIATYDNEEITYGYTIQVDVVDPNAAPAENDSQDYTEEPLQQADDPDDTQPGGEDPQPQEQPAQEDPQPQEQPEEPAQEDAQSQEQQETEPEIQEETEAPSDVVPGAVLTDGNNDYENLSEEERLYTTVNDQERYIIRYPRWINEEGDQVWNDEIRGLDLLNGFDLVTVNYKGMNVDTFQYKDEITAFVLKNLETDESGYYVLKKDGIGFEQLSYISANGKTFIVVEFPEDFVIPEGYQMVEMSLGTTKVHALKKIMDDESLAQESPQAPAEETPAAEAPAPQAPAAEAPEAPEAPAEDAGGEASLGTRLAIVTDERVEVMLKGYETKVSPGLDSADPEEDIYYIYCLVDGKTQLYSYDSKEGTLQRASIVVYEEIPTQPETVIVYEPAPGTEPGALPEAQTEVAPVEPEPVQTEADGTIPFLKGIGWNNMQIQVKVLLIALAVAIILIIILIILFAVMSSRNKRRNKKRKNSIPPRSAGRTAPLNENDDDFFSYIKTDDYD